VNLLTAVKVRIISVMTIANVYVQPAKMIARMAGLPAPMMKPE
jgi:hypothetical protein